MKRLAELGERIERLAVEPESVRDVVGWIAGPLLRLLDWRPNLSVDATRRLLVALRGADPSVKRWRGLLRAAVGELEENIDDVERACVVHRSAPMAHVSWLWRTHGVLIRAMHCLDEPGDARRVGATDKLVVLPPIVLAGKRGGAPAPLSVGAVDVLLGAARAEREVLARRRRLLEAARRVLLDVAAALPLEARGVSIRHAYVARQIAAIDRWEAAGVDPQRALTHQLRRALSRNERERLFSVLGAMHDAATRAGDGSLGRLTERALEAISNEGIESDPQASLERSANEVFGVEVVAAVQRGHALAKENLERRISEASQREWGELNRARSHVFDEDAALETMSAALSVDGCFEVGGVMSPVRVEEEIRRVRQVRFPTQQLVLSTAQRVDDVRDAVIEDPRMLLFALASGRLLSRRYIAESIETKSRTVLASEVRVYVLDGSTSMIGPRARMRDSILLAELATLMRRLDARERYVNPVLYFRYFTRKRWPMKRIATKAEALDAIAEVVGGVWTGGTDIEGALLSSFRRIQEEREADPDLARAQIVLVTDGESAVDEVEVMRARRTLGDLPTGVSVIALGQENPALRALAANQRRRGEEVFYQFVDDEELQDIVAGRADERLIVHLPEGAAEVGDLREQVGDLVHEIEAVERGREAESMEHLAGWKCALDEVGLDLDLAFTETERARVEALHRDRRALDRRFDRWFPEPPTVRATLPPLDESSEAEALALASSVLSAVAEVVDMVGSSELRRKADAIEVVERLLLDAGVPPWRWAEILDRHRAALAVELRAVRAVAGAR